MRGKKARELRRKAERLTVGEEKEITERFYKLLKKGTLNEQAGKIHVPRKNRLPGLFTGRRGIQSKRRGA